MIRNVILDWSGTLVDDLPAVWRASNEVFRRAGVRELTLEEFRAEFALPFKGFYDRHVPHVPLPELEGWFHGHFREVQALVTELPHAREFLQFCRLKGLRTFLLSTINPEQFAAQTGTNGFHEFLDRPYVGIWDKRLKIHELLAENGLDPRETIFVGDMQHDIETARHGGVWSCAVLTGYNTLPQLREARPDFIVEHLGELRDLLERTGLRLEGGLHLAPAAPVLTAGVLVFNARGDVLMIRTQKWSNLWGIPGGKMRAGETCEAAARRELIEETGLELQDLRLVMVQDCIGSKEFYRDAHFVLLNYTARCDGVPVVRLNEEAQEYRWVDLPTALRLPLNRPTRALLETVMNPPVSPRISVASTGG